MLKTLMTSNIIGIVTLINVLSLTSNGCSPEQSHRIDSIYIDFITELPDSVIIRLDNEVCFHGLVNNYAISLVNISRCKAIPNSKITIYYRKTDIEFEIDKESKYYNIYYAGVPKRRLVLKKSLEPIKRY